jgi:hypothetical protein
MNNELYSIQKECKKRQKELSHTIDSHARAAAAIDNRGWCELHIPELLLNYSSKRDEYWRQYKLWFGHAPENQTEREIDDQAREARFYAAGRVAFLLVETIAAAVLAAIFFNAPQAVAILIGVGLALLLGAASAAVVARWVRHDAALQPTKQMERITRGLLFLGVPWLVACVTALAVLRSQGVGIGALLFLAMTTLVTLLAPLCSGLCGYAADLLVWSKRLCAELRWVRSLARELDHLLTTSTRSIPPGSDGSGPPLASRSLKAIAAPMTTAMVMIMLLGMPVTGRAEDLPVYLYPDVSPSARAGDVIQILKIFTSRFSTYSGADDLLVSLVPFYEDAFMATTTLQVRIPGSRPTACPATDQESEVGRLSRVYAEAAKRDAARRCEELRAQARRVHSANQATEISKLNAAIDRLTSLKLPGHCTAVNAMIQRAIHETPRGVAVLISDLENTCISASASTNVRPENQMFVIPVGSRQHPVEEWFGIVQARYARAMPSIRVVESFRLDGVIECISHPDFRSGGQ